jgi:hypothetical protein
MRPVFQEFGKTFIFDPNGSYSYNTIEVGDNVFIGSGACFGGGRYSAAQSRRAPMIPVADPVRIGRDH